MGEPTVSVSDRLRILQVRGHALALDRSLAAIYGVATKQFNNSTGRSSETRVVFPRTLHLNLRRRNLHP